MKSTNEDIEWDDSNEDGWNDEEENDDNNDNDNVDNVSITTDGWYCPSCSLLNSSTSQYCINSSCNNQNENISIKNTGQKQIKLKHNDQQQPINTFTDLQNKEINK